MWARDDRKARIMSTVTVDNTQTLSDAVEADIMPNFGDGRYCNLMKECFKDAKRIFGFEPKVAEQLARNIASDFGAEMAHAKVEAKVGKINSEQRVTLAEAAKMKNVMATAPIRILRAMQYINDAAKNGINKGDTNWVLADELNEYVESKCS